MNQKEFIKKISSDTGFTQKDITDVFTSIEKNLIQALVDGVPVKLISGVTFNSVDKPETTARNPRTGETVVVPAKRVCKVKLTNSFKDKLK